MGKVPFRVRGRGEGEYNVISVTHTPLPFIPSRQGRENLTFCRCIKIILLQLLLFILCTKAMAVLPPSHYQKEALQSGIKAIAVVDDVSVIDETKRYTSKKVTFRLEQSFSEGEIPDSFTGSCVSVDHTWQEPGVGGEIYYYPGKGERVFVTIASDGGPITSYTPLTPQLEAAMTKSPEEIRYKMGKAYVFQGEKKKIIAEDWYLYHIDKQPVGYLHVVQNRLMDKFGAFLFQHEFVLKSDGAIQRLFIETLCRDDNGLTPEEMTLRWNNEAQASIRVAFEESPTHTVFEGVFKALPGQAKQTMPVPEHTITDLLMFEVVKKLSFEKQTLSYHLLESAELNLKKDRKLEYMGKDRGMKNLHLFTETTRGQASYWLDEKRNLMRVLWDRDKEFILSDREGAEAIITK